MYFAGESNNVDNKSIFSAQFSSIKSTNDDIKKVDTATVEKPLKPEISLTIKPPVADENIKDRKPTEAMSHVSIFSLSRGSKSDVDDTKKPHKRFKTDSLASSISLSFCNESTMNTTLEKNVNKKLVKFGIGRMVNINYNYQIYYYTIIAK